MNEEALAREHAIYLLDRYGLYPQIRRRLEEMTPEQFEQFMSGFTFKPGVQKIEKDF